VHTQALLQQELCTRTHSCSGAPARRRPGRALAGHVLEHVAARRVLHRDGQVLVGQEALAELHDVRVRQAGVVDHLSPHVLLCERDLRARRALGRLSGRDGRARQQAGDGAAANACCRTWESCVGVARAAALSTSAHAPDGGQSQSQQVQDTGSAEPRKSHCSTCATDSLGAWTVWLLCGRLVRRHWQRGPSIQSRWSPHQCYLRSAISHRVTCCASTRLHTRRCSVRQM
jgi:hypothetical protein